MAEELEQVLDRAAVDPAVHALRPDHRAGLLAVDGLVPAPATPPAART